MYIHNKNDLSIVKYGKMCYTKYIFHYGNKSKYIKQVQCIFLKYI